MMATPDEWDVSMQTFFAEMLRQKSPPESFEAKLTATPRSPRDQISARGLEILRVLDDVFTKLSADERPESDDCGVVSR